MSRMVVIGIGNELRGDDAAGLLAAREVAKLRLPNDVAVHESNGDPQSLMELWEGAEKVLLIDALEAGEPPGTVLRFDVSQEPLPTHLSTPFSTHALSLGEALELARVLKRLPKEMTVLAIQGDSYEHGTPLSALARKGIAKAVSKIREVAR